MKRKVVRLGPSTLVVSLPSVWIKQFGIKAGQEINVQDVSKGLLLSTESTTRKEKNIKIKENSKHHIYAQLSHIYRMGFDVINVKFSAPQILSKISTIVSQNLLGMEITEKKQGFCKIENITEPTDQKFDVLLKRIFFQIKETHSLIEQDLINKQKSNAEEVEQIRTSLDRYVFFCRRTISKKMNLERNAILHWELLTFLMHIHHSYYYLYKNYSSTSLSPKTLNLFENLKYLFESFYKAYFEHTLSNLEHIESEKRKIFDILFKEFDNTKNKDNLILSYIQEITRLIQLGSSPIRAINLESNDQ